MMMLALATAAAAQQSDEDARDRAQIEELRGDREELARSAADSAAQIDALRADDEKLVEELEAIEVYIELLQSQVRAAEASIRAAKAEAATADQEAQRLEDEIEQIREQLGQRAIDQFVQPRSDVVNQLANPDFGESAVKFYLLSEVIGGGLEITDDLRSAEAQLDVARRTAEDRAAAAERERQDQIQRLADLDARQEDAKRLRDEIQIRTRDWEQKAAEIADADKQIGREIAAIESEIAAREAERIRLAEEEERRARELARDEAGPFELVVRPAVGGVNSNFGPRLHPIFGTVRPHNGIDIDGDTGDPVRAARSGEVILAGSRTGFGNTIVISHGLGYSTLYAHLDSFLVSVNDTVASGDQIGTVGSTGWSTGPHLHFELRIDGKPVNPIPYLP